MNYQQAIADATKQIRCRSVAADVAATTDAATGSGSLSCFPAAADAAMVSDSATATDVAVAARATTADVAAGSGSFSCSAAAETGITTADAANVLIPEGSSTRTLSHCNNEH